MYSNIEGDLKIIKNMKVLDDAALEKISGAAITDEALDSIEYAVTVFKRGGVTFDEFIQQPRNEYHANPLQFSTDGSEKDLEELVSIYTEAWEQINPGNGGIIRIG